MSDRIEYLLGPEGFIRRSISEHPINAEDSILRALSDASVECFGVTKGKLGGVIHQSISPNVVVLAQHVPNVLLTTHFRPTSDGYLTPCWTPDEGSVSLDQICWVPPPVVRLWFVTRAESKGYPDCYFVFTRADRPGIFCLPLPNLYGDGKICMGDAYKPAIRSVRLARDATDVAVHEAALEYARGTSWNSDLRKPSDHTDPLFRFDFHGKQRPFTDGWDVGCVSVSSTCYNWLANASVFEPMPAPGDEPI